MKTIIAVYSPLVLLIICNPTHAGDNWEELAAASAGSWLSLVDVGDYGKSWKEAAAFFRNAVTADQWISSMHAFREPLGSVVSRDIISRQYIRSLPGAPVGDYVVIQYRTSFAKKASAVETVTPMFDPDKTWRVSGYFIK